MSMNRAELVERMLKEIKEARENSATVEDFQIERRLIEERYAVLLQNARD